MARLLIVDDEESFRKFSAFEFERLGWTVETAADGALALAALSENPTRFDAILLDRNMPNVSGDAVLNWLYLQQLLDDICVVVLTGFEELSNATDVLRMGAWHYIVKPSPPASELIRFLAPGIAIKNCHRIRHGIVRSNSLSDLLLKIGNVIRSALPELQAFYVEGSRVIDLSSGRERSIVPRAFLRRIAMGERFIFASKADELRFLQPIDQVSQVLMAAAVETNEVYPIGALVIESDVSQSIDRNWSQVLAYMADLISFEAQRQAESLRILQIVREFRHRLAGSVQILGQRARRLGHVAPSTHRNDVQVVERCLKQVSDVMDELAALAHEGIESDLRKERCNDVAQIVNDVVTEFERPGLNPRLEFIRPRAQAYKTTVVIDTGWLTAILQCLIKNAIEAIVERHNQFGGSNTEDRITTSCTYDAEGVSISISDTGIGYTEDIYERLFIPLFTTKTGRTVTMASNVSIDPRREMQPESICYSVELPTSRPMDDGEAGANSVEASFEAQDDCVLVTIRDTDPAVVQRFQAGRPVMPRGEGIGLASARRKIEQMGGSISASKPADFGATFTIRLPAAPES